MWCNGVICWSFYEFHMLWKFKRLENIKYEYQLVYMFYWFSKMILFHHFSPKFENIIRRNRKIPVKIAIAKIAIAAAHISVNFPTFVFSSKSFLHALCRGVYCCSRRLSSHRYLFSTTIIYELRIRRKKLLRNTFLTYLGVWLKDKWISFLQLSPPYSTSLKSFIGWSFVINFPEHYQCRYTYAKSKYNILGLQKFPKYVSNYTP